MRLRHAGVLAVRLGAILLALFAMPAARATGTAAGVTIDNAASAAFEIAGVPGIQASNTDSFVVDEALDVALVVNDAGYVTTTTPATNGVLSFTLTNSGNGPEDFRLTFDGLLGGDQFDPLNIRIYLDDGDGLFNIAVDTPYAVDVNNPALAADASRVVFVVADIPGSLAAGNIGLLQLTATAVTGSGAPGTAFPGAGENGGDAVVGLTTASAAAQHGYALSLVASALAKSQSFTGTPDTGTTVTYTLVFQLTGIGSISNAVIRDVIPALTTYVPGSITLNGSPLTDAVDGDDGRFDGTQVEVRPNGGSLGAPSTQTVTFDVTIN